MDSPFDRLAVSARPDRSGAADPPEPACRPSRSRRPSTASNGAIPKDWPIAVREEEDRVFVALIPQHDAERPGVAACELGLAPENLDEYRTRIDGNARRGGRPGAKLDPQRGRQGARRATGSRRSGSSAPGRAASGAR